MTDFVALPIEKLLNRQNPISRIETLEGRTGARPSASAQQLSQISQRTGSLMVDGRLVIINLSTGSKGVELSESGIALLEGNTSQSFLSFYNATGTIDQADIITILGDIVIRANTAGNSVQLRTTLTGGERPYIDWWENPVVTDQAKMEIYPGPAGLRVAYGYDHYIDALELGGTGSATVWFNERGLDIDFIVRGGTDNNLFVVDAGLDAIGMGGAPDGSYKLKVTGDINVTGDVRKNGTAYTNPDYALEKWATGEIIQHADKPGAKEYIRLTLAEMEAHIRQNFKLPGFDRVEGIFAGGDMLLEKVEELYTHVIELEKRIKALEEGKK